MIRSFIGAGLLALGLVIRHVGARSASGSGLVLDPKQAREDLEPWSRLGGGMVRDAMSEADIKLGNREPAVVVRCRQCKTTNPEHARLCSHCGAEI